MQRRSIDLAGVGITLESTDSRWWELLDERFEPFLGSAPQRLRIRLESSDCRDCRDYDGVQDRRLATPRVSRVENLIRLESWYQAEADLDSGRAWIRSTVHRAPVDHLLRQVIPLLLEDSLLIHGAMLVEKEGAWVLAGPSGSGKSTLARLLPDRAAAEEHCLLRKVGGRWQAHAMPFRRSRPGWFALRGLFLLRHGSEHSIRSIGASESVRRLAGESVWPTEQGENLERKWNLLVSLVADLEPRELAFRPTPDIWDFIAGCGADDVERAS